MLITTKKVHKLSFIVIIVLITTLAGFVFSSLAANETIKLESNNVSTIFMNNSDTQLNTPTSFDTVLVGFKTDKKRITSFSQSELNLTAANLPLKSMQPLLTHSVDSSIITAKNSEQSISIYRLQLESGANKTAVLQTLNNNPAVAFAEPDYLAHIIATPNDPLYSGQWGLTKIQAPIAWDVTTGSSDVVIAVIDSGMDMTHPDLSGQLWTNPGEIAGNGIDDDNNGYIDDVHGWNMVDDNADLSDNTGHGTEVAGIIAAASHNNVGITGLCWQCRIMVVKVTQPGGVANYSDIAAGIHYAAQKGADVINLSLGGYSDSTTLKTVIADAAETAVIVGGAGNDNDNTPFYPAAYNDYVLAVSGTSSSDTKVSTSNYGSWVDITAPGEVITTTFDGHSYGASSGTSLAAPFAAGVAGLLRSDHPSWSANQVRAQIIHTTNDIDGFNPGYENLLGSGRLNAQQSLTVATQPLLIYASQTVDGEENGRPEPNSTVDVDITLLNDWADATNVQATLNSSDPYVTIVNGTAVYGDIATYDTATNQTPLRITVSGSAPYAHDLALTLNVTADGGYATAVPITITTASSTEYVSGLIATNTVWSNDKQYIANGNILVQAGATLTIQEGTTIKFNSGTILQINGALVAIGSPEHPIHFTSNQGNPISGDWNGILFTDSSIDATVDSNIQYVSGSVLQHTIIEFATTGITCANASPFLGHNQVKHNSTGVIAGESAAYYDSRPIVVHNDISENQFGLQTGNAITVTHNRIANNVDVGVFADRGGTGYPGHFTNNLITGNGSVGLKVWINDAFTVTNNTISNNDVGIYIDGGSSPSTAQITNNNLINNSSYDFQNNTAYNIDAPNNWWNTTSTTAINSKIYDFAEDFNLGIVSYTPILTAPDPDAPAFLHNLPISPADPIGIETATFDLTFSRPMDESINPTLEFYSTQRGPYAQYNMSNSGLPNNGVLSIAVDNNGAKWFGTASNEIGRFDGTTWTTYDETNPGLPYGDAHDIAVGTDNSIWAAYLGNGVIRFDGTAWTHYMPENSGLPDAYVYDIAIDHDGSVWFATTAGVAVFDTTGWTVYNSANSALPHDYIRSIAIEADGSKWFGMTLSTVVHFDGVNWTTYTPVNSSLPTSTSISAIAIDNNNVKWFGTNLSPVYGGGEGVTKFDGVNWVTFTSSNSGLSSNTIKHISVDQGNAIWLSTTGGLTRYKNGNWVAYTTANSTLPSDAVFETIVNNDGTLWAATQNGISLIRHDENFVISDNGEWISPTQYRATYDITSLIPRENFVVKVSHAQGTDGMKIIADSRFEFAVDYAGEITDQTPPAPPAVIAGGATGDASTVLAFWNANDPDSAITGYRYTIGSAPGATDIVNWTAVNDTNITHSGLGLIAGRQYWLSVQARNNGGLWSASGYSAFISGKPFSQIFLPIILKR